MLVGHPSTVKSVTFSPDGKKIISGGEGNQNNLILWDMNNWGINNPDAVITSQVIYNSLHDIEKVFFSPDGTKLGASIFSTTFLWDIADLSHFVRIPGKCDGLKSFSHDSKSIVSYVNSYIMLSDISDTKVVKNIPLHDYPNWDPQTAIFNSDGKRIVSGSECSGTYFFRTNNLILWDVSDRSNITHQSLQGHPLDVTNVLFTRDDKNLISAGRGRSNNLILWPLLTDQEDALLKVLNTDQYTADQVQLIYTWCLKSLQGETVSLKGGSEEHNIFSTLPEDMQKLLQDLFFSKGWLSGWW